jgi:hypothetical protein
MKKLLLLSVALFCIIALQAQTGDAKKQVNHNTPKISQSADVSQFIIAPPNSAVVNADKGQKTMLLENANIVTDPGLGAGGADFSWPWDGNSWGSSCAIAGPFGITVNFDIVDISWTIDSVRVYAYQTGSTTTSTLNDVRIQIWSGVPGAVGSTVVWGDLTTNRMTSTRFTNTYRGTDYANTQRPIMVAVCSTPSLTLLQGANYFLEFRIGGTLASGPWCPPIIAGNDYQFASGVYTNTGSDYPLDIFGDKVAAACPIVSNINATNVEDVSLDLGWTENGTATLWDIEYGATGFSPTGTPTIAGVTTNPYTVSGLTAATTYDFYVRADCGGGIQSNWVGPFTATTANCASIDKCDYVFNLTDEWGDGWNGAAVQVFEDGILVATVTLGGGAAGSQTVSLCNAASVQLAWVVGAYDAECGLSIIDPDMQVVYSFGFGSAPVAGNFHLFTASCPTCPAPTGLAAANITMTSADLSWVAGTGTLWNAELGAAGFTPGTGAALQTNVGATTTAWAVSSLTAGTVYHFYVQNDCGGGSLSSWAGPFAFNTLFDCVPITTFPWNEGFEGAVFPPACFMNVDSDGDTFMWELQTAWDAHSGTNVAASASFDNATVSALTPDNWLITPAFVIDTENYAFSFWYAAQDAAWPNEKISVLVSTTGTAPADFSPVFTQVVQSATFVQAIIPLDVYDGETIYIAIRHWDCTDWFYVKVDDLQIASTDNVELSVIPSLNMYPNPTTDFVYVSEISNVEIYSTQGALVGSYSDVNKIDVSHLNAGFYIFKVYTNGKIHTAKVNIIR